MKKFLHPLLIFLVRTTEKALIQMVEYLKAENRILRNKLTKWVSWDITQLRKYIALPVLS